MSDLGERWEIFRKLAPYFGRVVSAKFVQKTNEFVPGVTRIHSLIQGIYKPADSEYAFAIASMLKNPYADRLEYSQDRSWYFYYSPKAGPLDGSANLAMFNCKRDQEPLLVVKQLTDKTSSKGTQYRVLGLGLIEDFDQSDRLFKIREVTIDAFQKRLDPSTILSDDLVETALQLEALEAWSPFVAEDRAIYKVSQQKRDAAFRRIVLGNYENTCAVSRSKFSFKKIVEAQAAHIIGKEANGTDDPRNGLALSHTAHWAFDRGLYTISDQFEIVVHPKAHSADNQNFELLKLDRQKILLPSDDSNLPHPDALRWHRENVFGKFSNK